MKCTFCGIEMDSSQERCPYCNEINREAVQRKNRVYVKEEKEGQNSILPEDKQERLINKVLNRVIAVLAVTAVLSFCIGFANYYFKMNANVFTAKPEEYKRILAETYEQGDYGMLYKLLEDYDAFGETYEYDQMALIHSDYEQFITSRNRCMEQMEAGEAPDTYLLNLVLNYGLGILNPGLGHYTALEGKNREEADSYESSVRVFFGSWLLLTEEEIKELAGEEVGEPMQQDERDKLIETVSERLEAVYGRNPQ